MQDLMQEMKCKVYRVSKVSDWAFFDRNFRPEKWQVEKKALCGNQAICIVMESSNPVPVCQYHLNPWIKHAKEELNITYFSPIIEEQPDLSDLIHTLVQTRGTP